MHILQPKVPGVEPHGKQSPVVRLVYPAMHWVQTVFISPVVLVYTWQFMQFFGQAKQSKP